MYVLYLFIVLNKNLFIPNVGNSLLYISSNDQTILSRFKVQILASFSERNGCLPIAMTIAKDGIRLLKVFGFDSVSIDEYLFENEASIWTLNLDKMVWSVEEINQKEFPTFGIHKFLFN